ncbi:MAG: winged helix-turn-helix domain-containing protein [Acidobacteriaceae bacterium]|nr:winged helix-turn-helix domain-containing protein [Acidobacteriaceae bacterium]
MPEPTQDATIRRFGAFEINLQSGELRKNGMRLRLSGQPFQVLAVLVKHAGEVVTREELHSELWPADTFVDFDHGLNNAVARIREVLDDSSGTPRYVETIPRRGYRFIAPLADARPAIVSLSTAEPKISPSPETPDSGAVASPDGPAEKSFAPTHLKMWLTAAAMIAVFVVGFVLYRSSVKNTERPAIKSLAVLPLENLSGDPRQEYLADGMTEELIGRLAGIHDLRVISRTSVMRFKDTKLSVPEIARTLGVDALVEGSVIREGGRVRVHAQLIRGATDEHFWSETYDRAIGDVLALQSDVAQAIAEKVEVTVTGQEHSRLVAARHVAPEVYESYLKGQFGAHNNRAELEESITYFEEAIRKDPTFAPAYLGVAKAYQNLSRILVGAPPGEMRPRSMLAARKALELDPELAEAHAILAAGYQRLYQWSEAEAEYRQALQLGPNDAAAHIGFANWLLCQGRLEEALAWARRARELDPLGTTGINIGWILFHARRYDEAIRELRSVLAVHPDSAFAHWYLGFALIAKGQPEEALPELERTASLMHRSPGSLELLATAEAHAGRRTEALRLINELKQNRQKGYIPAGALINPYLALHDYNEAFSWFERAYAEQSGILQFLKVHPFFDPLRGDPRFEDLVRRVGLK